MTQLSHSDPPQSSPATGGDVVVHSRRSTKASRSPQADMVIVRGTRRWVIDCKTEAAFTGTQYRFLGVIDTPELEENSGSDVWLSLAKEACGSSWEQPHVAHSPWDEDVFEWWHGEKKLTVYHGRERVEFIKVWGDDIHNVMDEG